MSQAKTKNRWRARGTSYLIAGHRPLITLHHGVKHYHRRVIIFLEWHMDPSDIAVLHTMGPEA